MLPILSFLFVMALEFRVTLTKAHWSIIIIMTETNSNVRFHYAMCRLYFFHTHARAHTRKYDNTTIASIGSALVTLTLFKLFELTVFF